jgi:hypothetical protein
MVERDAVGAARLEVVLTARSLARLLVARRMSRYAQPKS